MKKFETLNRDILAQVKQAFVAMPAGAGAGPVAGGGLMTQGQAAPMGGGMPPGMEGGMGGGMPPGMEGGMPPGMEGGMPPGMEGGMGGGMPPGMEGIPPEMLAGAMGGAEGGSGAGQIVLTPEEFTNLIQVILSAATGAKAKANKPENGSGAGAGAGGNTGSLETKIDQLLMALGGGMGGMPS